MLSQLRIIFDGIGRVAVTVFYWSKEEIVWEHDFSDERERGEFTAFCIVAGYVVIQIITLAMTIGK
jgi:hypothetical protein